MYQRIGDGPPGAKINPAHRSDGGREEVFLKTFVASMRGSFADAELVNIAPTGFLIRTRLDCKRGQKLRLTLPVFGDLQGEVAWSMAGCAGCRFTCPIDENEFPRLLAAIANASPDWLISPPPA